VYQLSDAVRSTHTKDGATVLDIAQGQMFSLNAVGSRIVELLKSECTPGEISAAIIREFGATRENAETDVDEFLRSLIELKLVEEVRPSGLPAKE
jgi:hypothetical protein